jgi:PAS domain S-box-containing protein
MVLTIRHRILLPFLFITVFMAFSSMFIGIELVQNYFDHLLYKKAQNLFIPIRTKLNYLAVDALLSLNSNGPITILDIVAEENKMAQFKAEIINNNLHLIHGNRSDFLFSDQIKHFISSSSSVYVAKNNELMRVNYVKDQPLNFEKMPAASDKIFKAKYFDHKVSNERFRSYFFEHSTIKNLIVRVVVPSADVLKKQQTTLVITISLLLGVNFLIIFIFFIILKRITMSLSEITEAAKQLSRGRRTSPLKFNRNDEIGLLAQSFNDMLNNVQTKTAELIYERNRSKMILTQLPDGIIVTDLKNKLISANRVAETMLGFSTDRAKGQELIRYLKNENLSSFFNHEFQSIKENTVVREILIPDDNGDNRHFQITVSPLLDSTYQKTGMITVIRNITNETQNRLLKENVLKSVAHELLTPLTSIIGFLTILMKEKHGPLNKPQKEFLGIVMVNSSMLNKLIHDLLLLSLIQSGEFKLDQRAFKISDIISELPFTHELIIKSKKNELKVYFEPADAMLHADKEKILQVLTNLILYVNKTTDNGIIECRVVQNKDRTLFTIKNSGVGLTDEQQTELNNAFLDSSEQLYFCEQFGMELAIVKALVHLHNGQIYIESKPHHGSAFCVIIPNIKTECYSDHVQVIMSTDLE